MSYAVKRLENVMSLNLFPIFNSSANMSEIFKAALAINKTSILQPSCILVTLMCRKFYIIFLIFYFID